MCLLSFSVKAAGAEGAGRPERSVLHLLERRAERDGRLGLLLEVVDDAGDLLHRVGLEDTAGEIAELVANPPSALGNCVAAGLESANLPPPPFAPFHAMFTMHLGA